MTKKQIKDEMADFDSLNNCSNKELSDLIDSIINNISKLSNERDFFFDYFKNIEGQMGLKEDKDFVKGVGYKKGKFILTLAETGNRINNIVNPKNPIIDSSSNRQPSANDRNINKKETSDEFKQ
jgi:hypothetical protein